MELAHTPFAQNHAESHCHPLPGFDAEALPSRPALPDADRPRAPETTSTDRLQRGHVLLDSALLRQLRQSRCMSQQDLADDCWRRNIPLSLTTIKRAETGRAVRFRIAREFARCLDVPLARIVLAERDSAPGDR
jgi:ribosome-binding protein aMBF1 (putative translation factor)